MLPEVVSAQDLADLFNLTVRRINMLAKEDGLPKLERGKFNLRKCTKWFLTRAELKLPEGAIQMDIGMMEDPDALRESQIKLNEARKKQVDLDVDTKRRVLIPAEEVKTLITGIGTVFANGHESIAGRICGEVVLLTDTSDVQKCILREMREVRRIVSDQLGEFADSLNTEGHYLAPTTEEREPVGRAM